MNDFEWNDRATQDGKVVSIDTKMVKENFIPHFKRKMDSANSKDLKYSWQAKNIDENHSIIMSTPVSRDDVMSNNQDDMYKDIKEDLRESERRIHQEIRDRELRFEKSMEKHMNDSREREERFMKTAEEIKKVVSDGEKTRDSSNKAMWTLAITTILGIAAMVITVVVTV